MRNFSFPVLIPHTKHPIRVNHPLKSNKKENWSKKINRQKPLIVWRLKCEIDVSGVHFKQALFVPNISVYNRVGSHALPPTDLQVDLSWQLTLQRVWESLIHGMHSYNLKDIIKGGYNF